jgi:hypothetical protein
MVVAYWYWCRRQAISNFFTRCAPDVPEIKYPTAQYWCCILWLLMSDVAGFWSIEIKSVTVNSQLIPILVHVVVSLVSQFRTTSESYTNRQSRRATACKGSLPISWTKYNTSAPLSHFAQPGDIKIEHVHMRRKRAKLSGREVDDKVRRLKPGRKAKKAMRSTSPAVDTTVDASAEALDVESQP